MVLLGNPPYPPPGCSRTASDNTSDTFAGVKATGLFGTSASAGFGTSSRNKSDGIMCNPDFNNKQLNSTKNFRSSSVNNDTIIMSKNALKSMSESTNQMIVNSISSMKSSSSQTVKVSQNIEINVKGVAGDVNMKGIANKSTVELINLAEISLSAFDDVKTDLANSVLQEFKNNTNVESMNTMDANLQTAASNQADAAIDIKLKTKTEQEQKTQLPHASPGNMQTPNTSANVNLEQENFMENHEKTELSNKFISDISTERIMETHIHNAVTQNFTKESISQLSQYLEQNQNIKITIEDVGGNVNLENIENVTNIVLRQTLSNKMDVGNAIINSVKNTMELETDDTAATKNFQQSGLTSKTDLRNGITSDAKMSSTIENSQKMVQDFGFGSCGSCSLLSLLPSIICIVCVLSFGSGGMSLISSIASSESSSDKLQANEEIDDSDSSKSPGSSESSESIESSVSPGSSDSSGSTEFKGTSVGGYYYFD